MSSPVSNIGDLWQRAAMAARRIAGARYDAELLPAITGRHIAVLAADGVDLGQLDAVKTALRSAGAKFTVLAHQRSRLRSHDGRRSIIVHHTMRSRPPVMFDALYIPGGDESVCTLCDDDEALRFVRETFRHGKSIAASGDGVQVLRVAGLPLPDDGRQAALSGLILEAPRAGLDAMSAAFVAAIAQRRHWQRPPLGGALHSAA